MAVLSTILGYQVHSLIEIFAAVFLVGAALVLLTYLHFARKHKFHVPGPTFVVPLIGGIVQMIRDPYTFWEQQRLYASKGISWTSIMNQYTIFATSAETCHKIFSANSKDSLTLVLHPNGRIILGENNIAFQTGPEHKVLRKSFLHLFTPQALGLYLAIQEKCIKKHVAEWIEKYPHGTSEVEMRELIRDLNCENSQNVFLGEHLKNRKEFTANYFSMTTGFLSAPIYFPGTALYKAVQSRKLVIEALCDAVRSSKAYMSDKEAQPTCLLDYWSSHVLEEIAKAKETQTEPPRYVDDHEMADTMMDFLFASQDASTASLTYLVANLCEHPDVLERVVREQEKLCHGSDGPLNYDLVQEMTYTRQVALEQLRFMPPAPMVPMLAHSDFQLTDDYVAPKGSLIIPSLVGACREGFPDPEKFDPERMGPEREEHIKFAKQYIPFGVGPHRCVGYNYAIQHLVVFLSIIARETTFKRRLTKDSHKTVYLPTLYPHDCLCTWGPRTEKAH